MLRRAASNAYSWWWASHIRTNQSKWLDNNLQEMDDRVKSMLKIIEEDADSFSRKAEMYFKKRPELITFVEETYRAYRALAERYDHISGELHKANHTIATAFPEQVDFDSQDEDDNHLPKAITPIDFNRLNRPSVDIPKDTFRRNIEGNPSSSNKRRSSNNDISKAGEEIDRIQKEILVLQTEKEYIRSSYESAIARHEEIEQKITSMQEELHLLHDEFSDSVLIDDDAARTLMATTALRSCEDTLLCLQENQKRSAEFTRLGSRKLLMAKEKLKSFKGGHVDMTISEESEATNLDAVAEDEVANLKQNSIQISPDMSVVELADKINELVNKVITLEITTSSQNAQIESLRLETGELHKHVESLEEEKLSLVEGSSNLSDRLKQTEDELQKIQDKKFAYSVKKDTSTSSDESRLGVANRSQKLQSTKHKSEFNLAFFSHKEDSSLNKDPQSSRQKSDNVQACRELEDGLPLQGLEYETKSENVGEKIAKGDESSQPIAETGAQLDGQDVSLEWLQLMLNGVQGKENILLAECSSILHDHREIKKRLFDVEKKNQGYVLETATQIRELKMANAMKDEEIQSMQRMLYTLQMNPKENEPEASNLKYSIAETTTNAPQSTSPVEEKFRRDIDALLDENLDFWLRFSTSFQKIQKFQMEFDDLQASFKRLKDNNAEPINAAASGKLTNLDSLPVNKQLRELKTDLQVWLEQYESLKGELQSRFTSLCNIQEEISGALASSLESYKVQFSPYQAAKFQGEVSNMQQENNKVADELQAGLDHVRGLRSEMEKILSEFHEKFEPSSSQGSHQHNHPFRHFSTKSRIPLRNFLFGVKQKKKPSILRCVNPAYQKQYSDLSAGF
ncbi:hypothetical protein AXF42_Ash020017 [Apostasia shenzhenica]|uniref:NAB domain-containing protein n=1 Tax=Apostasia shenzhenica TaxID=1088818 RepID=A0A2H9ZSJ7_9ASPA|nr:hypothetical protein AXF42_Ash020017 [Apostasia shenzhenica]